MTHFYIKHYPPCKNINRRLTYFCMHTNVLLVSYIKTSLCIFHMEWKNKQQLNEFLELEKKCKEDSKLQPSSNQLADTNVTEFVINVSLPSPSRMVRQTQSLFKDILFLSSLSASS